MIIHLERRGTCLIEAGARDLRHGLHWQPWLRLTRGADTGSASHTFDSLKPVFGTKQAALRYAAELGRTLADEEAMPVPASPQRDPVTWPRFQVFARLYAFWSGVRAAASAHFPVTL